ncbi:MAG: hypothetical protein ACRBCI_14805 [Cellvibrionaceae bacterium]
MKKKVIYCIWAVVVLLLAGCEQRTEVLKATHYSKHAPAYAKPGANIALENRQVNLEFSGLQYAIDIDLLSGYDSGELTLSVKASEGLYILEGDLNPTMTLTKGIINLSSYNIMASKLGRYYIYVNAKVEKDNNISARALTFIVQIGDETTHSVSQKSDATNGVISMPAKEVIIQD